MGEQGSSPALAVWVARGVQFGVLVGFYRLLVGTNEGSEWAAGVIAAALATAATSSVAVKLPAWAIPARGLGKVVGLVPRIGVESVRVALSSLRAEIPAGTFDVVAVDGGGDDARSVGRRGLVVAGGSLAPDSVVVTLDRDRGMMLVHRLLSGPQPTAGADREWPL